MKPGNTWVPINGGIWHSALSGSNLPLLPLPEAFQSPGNWQGREVTRGDGRAKGTERGADFCRTLRTFGVRLSLGHLFTICDFYSRKLYYSRSWFCFYKSPQHRLKQTARERHGLWCQTDLDSGLGSVRLWAGHSIPLTLFSRLWNGFFGPIF